MFQTNPPEFDSVPENTSKGHDVQRSEERRKCADKENHASPVPEFATLDAFSAWMDVQLAQLEATHEGFETISSVRGFYGR